MTPNSSCYNKWYYKTNKPRIKEYNKLHKPMQNKRYYEKHKEVILKHNKQYRKSPTGKIAKKRSNDKRNRGYKWIELLPNVFPCEVQWHHVHNWFIVPVPVEFHNGFKYGKEHRIKMNDIIWKIYGVNIKELINDG